MLRRQVRTWTTMLAAATLMVGTTTVVHGWHEPVEAGAVPASDGEAAAGANLRCQSWGFQVPEGSAADASIAGGPSEASTGTATEDADAGLRGVCLLPPWDWSEDWPFKQKLEQAHYGPGVGAGATPQTQIMGMGFGTVRFPKGGATKAVRDLIKSGELESDDVVVLGKPNKKGEYRVYLIGTGGQSGAADGGERLALAAGAASADAAPPQVGDGEAPS